MRSFFCDFVEFELKNKDVRRRFDEVSDAAAYIGGVKELHIFFIFKNHAN